MYIEPASFCPCRHAKLQGLVKAWRIELRNLQQTRRLVVAATKQKQRKLVRHSLQYWASVCRAKVGAAYCLDVHQSSFHLQDYFE